MKKKDTNFMTSKFFTPIFILAICVLLIISTFAYRSTIALDRTQEQITRSYQIKSELNHLYAKLKEAESSQWQYMLTDENDFLKPYEEGRGKIDKIIKRLELYAQSSPEQAERLSDLKWSINAALYSLEDGLAIDQEKKVSKELLTKKISDSSVLLGSVKELIGEMVKDEDYHIREYRLQNIKESSFTPFGSLLLILFALLALVLFYYQVNEDFVQLQRINTELESTNEELNSFNHITSHDLQEPLRKIETFISRLDEKEKQKLSDNGKVYLEKINSSARNMRRLIKDLLLFSQTNSTERELEIVELQSILNDVQTELEEELQSKNGEIIIKSELPEVKAIPFQLKQLLLNLIGNSIKYAKSDVAPVIEVSHSIIDPDKHLQKFLKGKHYHKISIADNGIGFDQQYAHKIFELFERLHQKNDYSGSGIGLAICKKIVENHEGSITAEGKPGVGSTFHIYLPL